MFLWTSTGITTGLSFVPCVDPSLYLTITLAGSLPTVLPSGFEITSIDSISLPSCGVICLIKSSLVISLPCGVSSLVVFNGFSIFPGWIDFL